MIDVDRCRVVLSSCLPALELREVRYLAEGWDSAVFLVNDDLLVRFPKRAEVRRVLEQEARLLPELTPLLPVPIPSFVHVVRGCSAFPWPFAAYRRIDGVPASDVPLDLDRRAALATQIGRFLRALHAFPLARAAELEVGPAAGALGREAFRALIADVHGRVGPLLGPDERRRLVAWFQSAEGNGILEFSPALVHGDLGAPHLLFDPTTGDLAGVIDFGDAGIGDPAIDFAGLLTVFDEEGVRSALAAYGRPDDETLLTRARLHSQLFPLYDVLFGLATDEEAHVRDGLAGLRARLLEPDIRG